MLSQERGGHRIQINGKDAGTARPRHRTHLLHW